MSPTTARSSTTSSLAVPDPASLRKVLADEWGLQVHPDGITFEDGLANLIVPREPPEYLEILYINDRDAFSPLCQAMPHMRTGAQQRPRAG
jgi:hypothetical protein